MIAILVCFCKEGDNSYRCCHLLFFSLCLRKKNDGNYGYHLHHLFFFFSLFEKKETTTIVVVFFFCGCITMKKVTCTTIAFFNGFVTKKATVITITFFGGFATKKAMATSHRLL